VFALCFGELHAQGVFQGGSDGWEVGQLLLALDAEEGIAGVGCEEPRHVFKVGQGGGVKATPLEELYELPALELGRGAWMGGLVLPEVLFIVGEGKGFALEWLTRRAVLHNQKLAQVRHQHNAVGFQIVLDLLGCGNGAGAGLDAGIDRR
jgi:hypothetical protein